MKQIKNILLVDDDEITNFLNSQLIEGKEVAENVHTVLNGQEALDYLKKHCIDRSNGERCPSVIFLDLNMPVMDGFEFLEKFNYLEEIDKNGLPVFILTSSENKSDVSKAERFNVTGYISKPLTTEKVDFAIQKVNEL